jgi:hypothetical protein
MNLAGCAEEIQHRLIHIFGRDEHGRRAVNGGNPKLNRDPHFRDYVHFYEVSQVEKTETETSVEVFLETGADVSASSSMGMMVEGWARLIRLAGRGWSRGVSCRLASTAACQRRREVSGPGLRECEWKLIEVRSAEVRRQALL